MRKRLLGQQPLDSGKGGLLFLQPHAAGSSASEPAKTTGCSTSTGGCCRGAAHCRTTRHRGRRTRHSRGRCAHTRSHSRRCAVARVRAGRCTVWRSTTIGTRAVRTSAIGASAVRRCPACCAGGSAGIGRRYRLRHAVIADNDEHHHEHDAQCDGAQGDGVELKPLSGTSHRETSPSGQRSYRLLLACYPESELFVKLSRGEREASAEPQPCHCEGAQAPVAIPRVLARDCFATSSLAMTSNLEDGR